MDVRNVSQNHFFEHSVGTSVTNDIDITSPCVNLELFDFALPPTPENSLNSLSDYDKPHLCDDDFVESMLQSDMDKIEVESQRHRDTHTDTIDEGNISQSSQILDLHAKKICGKGILTEKEKEVTARFDSHKNLEFGKEDTDKRSCTSNKRSRASGLTQFPPCVICSGKASGSHYGAITCEACKGFFRRYLQKKTDFKCTEGRNCDIVFGKKGICSGCRLQKCLNLGMSKEKSKMGRYTLAKRTEAIISLNMHERKQFKEANQVSLTEGTDENVMESNNVNKANGLLMSHLLKGPKSLNLSGGFNNLLVTELVQCFCVFEPYGPNIKTKEQLARAHQAVSERYKRKVELFGKMKAVSWKEYKDIYSQHGIDIDGRMADMKLNEQDVDSDMTFLCNFVKHIPDFHKFPLEDQVSLLNSLMIDFYNIVYLDCYNEEYETFLYKNGQGYHFEEMAGRELSEKLVILTKKVYCRLQMLDLNIEERALIAALTVVSADRCQLQNRDLVEKVQESLTGLLQTYLKKNRKEASKGRFTKIIDTLTFMREMTDQYRLESNEICKDELLQKEFPQIKEFFIEENY